MPDDVSYGPVALRHLAKTDPEHAGSLGFEPPAPPPAPVVSDRPIAHDRIASLEAVAA